MKTNSGYAADVLLTAIAPAIWGSTYYVATSFLPTDYPLTVSLLRALPAGLLLLLLVRQLPHGIWWRRAFVLGALNFSFFWAMLFVSAYRLPGGVAATVGAVQPLIVIALSRLVLAKRIRPLAVVAGLTGHFGVALLGLAPRAALPPIRITAGGGPAGVGGPPPALGPPTPAPPPSSLTFTAWQLTAGGLLLIPLVLWLEPVPPVPTTENVLGMAYLGLIGAAFTYLLWFRGLSRIEPSAAASLGFLSPLVATLLGWLLLGQSLSPLQIAGFVAVLASVWISQQASLPAGAKPAGSRAA